MRNGRSLGVVGAVVVATTAGCGIIPPEPNSTFAQGLNTITVLVRDGRVYPIYQFRCSGEEPIEGPSEACPEGAGCDGDHYHGSATSLGFDRTTGISDVDYSVATANDPDQCRCGWGKVGEADVRELTVFVSDIDQFFEDTGIARPETATLTTAQAMSVDPCGG